MKRGYVFLLVAMAMVVAMPRGRAQFLKNLVSNAAKGLTNEPATNAGSSVPRKQDSGSKQTLDSATLAKMLAGIDTPPPMTAADSAVLKTFRAATGGSGMEYQYQVKYDLKIKNRDSVLSDTMAQIITDAHNTCVEMNLFGTSETIIGHADQRQYSVVLYPVTKMYKLNKIDSAVLNQSGSTYTVTKVGTETVAGYSCVHSKLTMVTQNTGKPLTVVEDLWTSTAVPGYAQLKQLMASANITIKMLQALDQAGCGGFVVKVALLNPTFSMNMVLMSAVRKTFPASMFEIPAGYTPATGMGMMNGMLQGIHK
jgi:Domain of unknown function (DUF4412)